MIAGRVRGQKRPHVVRALTSDRSASSSSASSLANTYVLLSSGKAHGRFKRASRLEGGDLGQQRVLFFSLLRRRRPLHRLGVAVALAAARQALLLRALRQY